MENIQKFKDKGYFIDNVLTKEQCDEINYYIENNNKNAYYEKNTNQKFGYKFDKNEISPVKDYVNNNEIIITIASSILNDFDFSVIKSFYKSAFMSRDIEYHQEFYYNAHHPSRNNWQDYIQIFIALEDHSLTNACLKIIPESHKLGLLPYTNIVNSNLEHKQAVEYNSLKKAFNKYGILNCELKTGQAIFFNHLIIHGSQNNNSPITRKALVCTLYKSGLKLDEIKYNNFEKDRKKKTIKILEDKITELNSQLNKL